MRIFPPSFNPLNPIKGLFKPINVLLLCSSFRVEISLHWSKNLPVVIKPEAKLLITDLLLQCEGKTIKHREQVGGVGGE